MPWSPDKIPIWLRRTPEQQAADKAYQDRLRQARGPGRRPNRLEQRLLRAQSAKVSATAQLKHFNTLRNPNPEHVAAAQAQLADALATAGDYAEAAELHPNPEWAERYHKIAEAVDRDDEEGCDCKIKQTTDPATGQPVMLSPTHIEELVVSKKHGGRLMPLVVCGCGDMNVKAAPAHLEDRMRRTEQAQQAAKEKRS